MPHQLGMPLLQLFNADHEVEHHEEEDAEECDDHGVLLVGDARDHRKVVEEPGSKREERHNAPESGPQDCLKDGFFAPHHQIPRVEDGKRGDERSDDLVGGEAHRMMLP